MSRAKIIVEKFLSSAYVDESTNDEKIPRKQRTFKTMFDDLVSESETIDEKSHRGIKLKKFISMLQSIAKKGLEDSTLLNAREYRIGRITRGAGRRRADFDEMVMNFYTNDR
ncbi:hypothetical protein ACP275_08G195900 [Erythranthe tilingii]